MRRVVALAVLTLLVARGAEAQRPARPTIDTVNHHIVRVMNNGPTAWADTNGWKLVYERTVQPAEGSPGMFGNPTDVHLLPDGKVIEVEDDRGTGAPVVRLFGVKGDFVRELGRAGEGPGEYRTLQTTLWHDTLVIHDHRLARATFMTLEGKPLRSFHSVCCAGGFPISVDDRGRLRVRGGAGSLFRFDRDGHPIDSMKPPQAVAPRVWQTPDGATYRIPFATSTGFGTLADGSIVYGNTDRELFTMTRSGLDTVRIFGRSNPTPIPMRPSLRDSLFQVYDHNPQVHPIIKRDDIPTTLPVWNAIHHDAGGNVWVTLGDGHYNPVRGFDVFSADGRFLGTVASPSRSLLAMSWTTDHVAVADLDGNDLPRIRIFRIDRRGH